jgi:hypothetical protein
MEDPNEVSDPWAPTGSNILPLGSKSTNSNGSVLLPSFAKQPLASVTAATSRARLKLAANRYLPPPGPYYDQFSLATSLDIKFTSDKCWTCWNIQSSCTSRGTCMKTCKICGTSSHPGKVRGTSSLNGNHLCFKASICANDRIQVCPSLYCTISWFHDRNVSPSSVRDAARQVRPSQKELEILLQQGLVLDSGDRNLPIIPNMAHPAAQDFYRKKPAPQAIKKNAKGGSSGMAMNSG